MAIEHRAREAIKELGREQVAPDHLAALDRFEGMPRLYERMTLRLADGSLAEAYVQRMMSSRTPDVIASGDWRAHRKGRSRARTNQG